MTDLPKDTIRLWPDGPPLTLDGSGPEIAFRGPYCVERDTALLRNVSEPMLTVVRPAKPNGTGVIVCPGGGFRILAWQHEGIDVATWLAARGYTAFVLKYRLRPTPVAPADYQAAMAEAEAGIDPGRTGKNAYRALAEIVPPDSIRDARAAARDDARRALTIVRERAGTWDVDPARVGLLGLSAGAFLAVDVAMDPRSPLAFVAALYGGETQGSPVPADAPPLFAGVAQDDFVVHRIVEGLYSDWTDAGRPAELHIWRRGGHGFGLASQGLPSDRWPEQFCAWLADLGL